MKLFFNLLVLISLLHSSDYEDWLKQQNSSYNNYKKSMDEEFTSMLKEQWKSYKTYLKDGTYSKPKPKAMPKTIEKEITKKEIQESKKVSIQPIIKKEKTVIEIKKIPKKLPKIVIPKDIVVKKVQEEKEQKKEKDEPVVQTTMTTIKFDFYNSPIALNIPNKLINYTNNKASKENIAKFWDFMANSSYKDVVEQIEFYTQTLQFNDWAKYVFIYKLGQNIYHNNNLANLFTWFILVKDGYDMRVAYNENIYLLAYVNHSLYQISYFNLNKKKYYTLSINGRIGNIGQIYTYKGNYPNANKPLNLYIKNNLHLKEDFAKRELSFKYDNKNYKIDSMYNKNLVNFYANYPQVDFKIYFKEAYSSNEFSDMLSQLKDIIQGKSELEAVNMLLRFTQTAFSYQTDPEQFKREKPLFPSETINYPYSDCEDRSIFFAFLVKELIGLKVVAVKFPDHLATAVEFSTNISGDAFKFKGKRYVIADPTYINANVGMRMPKYKSSKFEVIQY